MGLLRDLQAAVREGLADLLKTQAPADEVEEVTSLLEADVNETRTELNLARADVKRLQGRIDQERGDAQRYHSQAQESVNAGDDEAARDYLRRHRRSLRGAEILASQLEEQRQLIDVLAQHADELDDKLQEVRLRRDFLRSRSRVRELKDHYERLRRDYGLDPPPLSDEFDLARWSPGEQISREELLGEAEPRPRRPHASAEEPPADAAPEPVSGLGEVPRPRRREEQPQLRPRGPRDDDADDLQTSWDKPPSDPRRLADDLLARIEARQRNEAFEDELDRELAAMKEGNAAEHGRPSGDAQPTRRFEPPTAAEPPAGGPTEPADHPNDRPPLAPEPPVDEEPEASDEAPDQPGPGA